MRPAGQPQASIDDVVELIVAGYGPIEKILLSLGKRVIAIHSVAELAGEAAAGDSRFAE